MSGSIKDQITEQLRNGSFGRIPDKLRAERPARNDRRFAIRRGLRGWERWDGGAWVPLPQRYADVSDYDARMYASGRYGCFFRQVNIEAPA